MADQDRGWPGSGLVLIMADQDYFMAGRDYGWAGS